MINENTRLNIILGVICLVLTAVIIYIVNYRNNIESINVYFDTNEIKDIVWRSPKMTFNTDGNTFTLVYDNNTIFDNEPFNLDNHTGEIVKDRLYIRSVGKSNILLWYDEAEYKLDKNI